MKRFAALCAAVLFFAGIAARADNIQVRYNGKQVMLSYPPYEYGGHVMVPMRSFFESLGFAVGWDSATQSVTASGMGSKRLSLQIGSKKIFVNNSVKTLDAAPVIVDDVTYIPVDIISFTLDCRVDWDAEGQTVNISSSGVNTGYSKYPGTQVINFGERFSDAVMYAKGFEGSVCYYAYFAEAGQAADYRQMLSEEGWVNAGHYETDGTVTDVYQKIYNKKTLTVSVTAGFAAFSGTHMYSVRIAYEKSE